MSDFILVSEEGFHCTVGCLDFIQVSEEEFQCTYSETCVIVSFQCVVSLQDVRYLMPLVKEVEKERLEKQEWQKK